MTEASSFVMFFTLMIPFCWKVHNLSSWVCFDTLLAFFLKGRLLKNHMHLINVSKLSNTVASGATLNPHE